MISKEKTQLANWFLNFLNLDLQKISDDKKNMLTVQALSIVYGMGLYKVGNESKPEMPADRWENEIPLSKALDIWSQENKIESCQQHLRQFFEKFFKTIETSKTYAQEWKPEFKNYFCFDQIQSAFKVRIETPLIRFEDPEVINKGEHNEQVLFRLNEGNLLTSPIRLAFRAEKDEDTLLLYFFHALEWFPISAFRQCPQCGKYFIHMSKRLKNCCSNLCSAKFKGRVKRKQMKESDPDKYSSYLSDESDRKRRELVKKTKRGKPKRNPWKYKDSKEP